MSVFSLKRSCGTAWPQSCSLGQEQLRHEGRSEASQERMPPQCKAGLQLGSGRGTPSSQAGQKGFRDHTLLWTRRTPVTKRPGPRRFQEGVLM